MKLTSNTKIRRKKKKLKLLKNPFHIQKENKREIEYNHNLLSRFTMSMPMPMFVCIFMSFLFFLYLLWGLHRLRHRYRLFGSGWRRLPRLRRVDSAVKARRAFPLHPALEVVLPMTHDAATGTKPADHAGYHS